MMKLESCDVGANCCEGILRRGNLGFSLIEILVAMFILSFMITVLLKHQLFLLDMQQEFEARNVDARRSQNQVLRSGI